MLVNIYFKNRINLSTNKKKTPTHTEHAYFRESACKFFNCILFLYRISFSPNTGVCQHYTGKCRTLLNSSEPRFINKTIGYNGTESVATALLEAVEKIYDKKMQLGKKETNDDVCKPILKKAVCFFVFPLCSSQQQKMDICREDCDYLYELCGKDLDHVRMSLIYNILFGQSLCTIASTSATSRVEFQLLCIFQACRCWPVFAFRQVVWYCFSLR